MTRKPGRRTADRHKSKFMVRLPEHYRTALRLRGRRVKLSVTAQVAEALDRFLWSNDVERGAS